MEAQLPGQNAPTSKGRRRWKNFGGVGGEVGVGVGLSREEQQRQALPVLLAARRALVLSDTPVAVSVATGALPGWCARLVLGRVAAPAPSWGAYESAPGRSRAEVLAAVDRALRECGYVRRGGWRVAGRPS